MENKNKISKLFNKLTNLLFFLSILFFTVGLNLQDNPPNGWYQQFLPDISGASINDITFTDSLTGYAVTNIGGTSSYMLKTTNGGDNWIVKFTHNQQFQRIIFINSNTGFTNAFHKIFKTTNAGENWDAIDLPGIFGDDMFVLNEDTIWLAMSPAMFGGLYRTTNGGTTWTVQINWAGTNPDKIYMYDRNLGFMSRASSTYRTTNSGVNWTETGSYAFQDIYLIDSLVGWKAHYSFWKTTDGGISWITQTLPSGGLIQTSPMLKFSNINEDSIWGVGGTIRFGPGNERGLIWKTTNGGENWGYQVADTSIHLWRYYHSNFVNKLNGWAHVPNSGVHTVTGGNDTTFYVGVNHISNEIPKGYKLYQNYPNPFNNETIIKYELKNTADIRLCVYDISGKLIRELVKEKQSAGSYEYRFNGAGLPSGVYFYRLVVDGDLVDTKKMVLIK